mmetsp:Transcript_13378/g.28375  ORF Transcript_13378/g.28375 Transcript_13378/m.28375 type:complete len:87 (+) Transcript_13378:748-1008(+)
MFNDPRGKRILFLCSFQMCTDDIYEQLEKRKRKKKQRFGRKRDLNFIGSAKIYGSRTDKNSRLHQCPSFRFSDEDRGVEVWCHSGQ